ncbi:MAG TPA: hypothetical protein VFA04_06825, partial [Bryobacteraceae bacterium]|nr:hypothetical protein [Bryobacteraceae bacterium]
VRSVRRTVSTADVLARIDDPLTFLIEFGELESALVDQLCPEYDIVAPDIAALREVSREAGRAFISGNGRVREALAGVPLPASVEVTVPAGYAWHGLTPAAYIQAAAQFWTERRPAKAVVIGIRGIGTSLSAVVAAVLEQRGCSVQTYTVRPHGHAGYRQLKLREDLQQALAWQPNTWYVVVDDGPGLSGSSFAATAQWLSALRVPDERIVFMPAWLPDGSCFISRGAEARWRIHAKYPAAPAMPGGAVLDLSAGAWRELFYSSSSQHPAVQPQHEVPKFLARANDVTSLVRFAGLGRYGREKLERARLLSAAGFSMTPLALEDGWLKLAFEPGRPLTCGAMDNDLLDTIARYIAFRRQAFATGDAARTEPLANMVRVNLGVDVPDPPGAEAAIMDGRMMPHEWIATPNGYLKADALDHGDNDFYPGPSDPCWDLAGAMIEWQLDDRRRSRLVRKYIEHSRDRRAAERMPFYLLAYTAFRAGYTHMAVTGLPPSPDRACFEKLHAHYRAVGEREAAQLVAQ